MNGREVWITGIGAVSSAGIGTEPMTRVLASGRATDSYAAPAVWPERRHRHLDRSALFFLTAAEEAWRSAGLSGTAPHPGRAGVLEGSSLGSLSDIIVTVEQRLRAASAGPPRPSSLVRFQPGAGSAAFAQAHGLHGPVYHLSAGSVSATSAIGEAWLKIAAGHADLMVAGGGECPLHPEIVAAFRAAGILAGSKGGDAVCRPFDDRRSGTMLGEGAGALVLEDAEHARARGAAPMALLSGYGMTCEAYSPMAPDPSGAGVRAAIAAAMEGEGPGIGWIKSHGTGTRANDEAECRGIAAALGARLSRVTLTSLKSTFGHCLGASGAVETVATVLAMRLGIIPATVGTERVDPALPPCQVATRVTPAAGSSVLLLSESFGGRCAALVLRPSPS